MLDGDSPVSTTRGAVLSGALVSLGLSGGLMTQVALYWHIFGSSKNKDTFLIKTLVFLSSVLDTTNSALIFATCWIYFITNLVDSSRADLLHGPIAFTVLTTALQTLLYHVHFAIKIYRASDRKWWITILVGILALGRLVAAIVSTVEILRIRQFSEFRRSQYPGWVFTLGIVFSASAEILISSFMCWYLYTLKSRASFDRTLKLIDKMFLYSLESGVVTSLFTIATLVCWLSMPRNLVFLGMYFVKGKLYANSLLASLNARKVFRSLPGSDGIITVTDAWLPSGSNKISKPDFNVATFDSHDSHKPRDGLVPDESIGLGIRRVEVNVERIIERVVDGETEASNDAVVQLPSV